MTAAFAGDDTFEREIRLGQFGPLPAKFALRVHFTDILVHGWDLSVAVGSNYRIVDDLAEPALAFAKRLPDVPGLRGPDAAFDHPVEVPQARYRERPPGSAARQTATLIARLQPGSGSEFG